jgi:hypothetical protein
MKETVDREHVVEALRGIDSRIQRVRDRIATDGPSSVTATQEQTLTLCLNLVSACTGIPAGEVTRARDVASDSGS